MSGKSLQSHLSDPRRYERQIDRLHRRYLLSRKLYELRQGGVPLASLVRNRKRVARLIAGAVSDGSYRLEPACLREILVQAKKRIIYTYRLTDIIVIGAVSDLLDEALAPLLAGSLYSYRRGLSWWRGVRDFADYARSHSRSHPEPRGRGLYVIRQDIKAYTDSIPVGEDSPLWGNIRRVLATAGFYNISPYYWHLIQKVIRPEIDLTDGSRVCNLRGLPTGQPIASVLFNLYPEEVDHQLERFEGAFYARYSDDLIFAHPDSQVVREADRQIGETLGSLGLSINRKKTRSYYLTGCGRDSVEWPEATGTTSVPFLGMKVSIHGTIGLQRRKSREFLREIDRRVKRTAGVMRHATPDSAGRAVCSTVNSMIDPASRGVRLRAAALLRRVVTDRGQLKNLDYQIARRVASSLSGDPKVVAFRKIPYRRMRGRWGLVSLYESRNRVGRPKRKD